MAMTIEDSFRGDDAKLISCIESLITLNDAGALVPHGIGGHARTLLSSAASRLQAHLTQPAQAVDVGGDTRRIDHLERLIQCAYLGACFELDGGIHLTIEAPGSEPVAYRYKNNLREAIDADIASGGDHQA